MEEKTLVVKDLQFVPLRAPQSFFAVVLCQVRE